MLQQIYDWALSLGLEIPIDDQHQRRATGAATAATYNLECRPTRASRPTTATIALVIVPAGVEGRHRDGRRLQGRPHGQAGQGATSPNGQVAKIMPNDKQSYSITLRARRPPPSSSTGSIHWMTRGGRPAGPKDFVEIGGEEKKPEGGAARA